jgi:hypothetical protein
MLSQKELSRFWEKVDKNGANGCWNWTASDVGGYGQFRLGLRMVQAHRISWELAFGEIPDKLHVLHQCDNPPCVNPAHLFLGTHQDNVDDRQQKGRTLVGEQHGKHKLSDIQVAEIRRRYSTGKETQTDLAKVFGIAHSQISKIVNLEQRV